MATPIYRQGPQGSRSLLNITAATLVSLGQGMAFNVSILVSPTAAGGIYDSATVAGAAQSNMIAPIAVGEVGIIHLDGIWFFNGLVINPGTGGAVSVWYSPSNTGTPLNISY